MTFGYAGPAVTQEWAAQHAAGSDQAIWAYHIKGLGVVWLSTASRPAG
jgi:hypothetical protein